MKLVDFDYALPRERIAQRPPARRDGGRMLVVDRHADGLADAQVGELPAWLAPGDLLVLNDTRVVPARLVGTKSSGGRVELLLLEPIGARAAAHGTWRCWLAASRKPAPGARVRFGPDLEALVVEREARGEWVVRLSAPGGALDEALAQAGRMPLPPYISRPDPDTPEGRVVAAEDRERYQTVFAARPGAVAAPTAGLHFTRELLERLARAGIDLAYLTLHVGPGTFEPVRAERVEDHAMHAERFEIPAAAVRAVQRTRARGGRVVAVGTTVVRALEHVARLHGELREASGECDLFIRPGFEFRVVDALLTNFHLPRSTLLVLVSAFAGRERVLAAYDHAVRAGYRFYSYGDAMLVRPAR